MTKEEKQKKAEEKARRKAEVAEQRARRKTQLAALKNYWHLIQYDLNGRACPQDFFLFWVRQFLLILPLVFSLLGKVLDVIWSICFVLPVIVIVVAILALIFPPVLMFVLMFVKLFLVAFATGVIWMITVALLFVATYTPFFLAIVKRRINDVSKTAIAAHARFIIFVCSGIVILPSFVVCFLSWVDVAAFAAGGMFSWLTDISYALMLAGFVSIVGQMYFYTYKAGVNGVNFAGENPTEVPLTEEALAERGRKLGSRSWQLLSLVLVGCAIAISFALSSSFLRFISMASWLDTILRIVQELLPFLVYGVQAVVVAIFILLICSKGRYKKGDLGRSEIDSINECFMVKSDLFAEEMKKKAMQAAEEDGKKRAGTKKSLFALFDLVIRAHLSLLYYVFLILAIYYLFKGSCVLAIMLLVLTLAAVAYYNYFKSNVGESFGTINWRVLISDSGKQLLYLGREVVLLPFSLSDTKSQDGTKLPTIAEKRLRVRNLSFIDPLGIHQFALGQLEMGGVQILFCLLVVGMPISWLWSILDGIRFSRMSDEEFLVEYHGYCCTNGLMDKVVRLMNKFAIWVAPIAAAMMLFAFAFALDNGGVSDDVNACVKNMDQIQVALEMAAVKNEMVTNVSDFVKLGYFKKEPKCPNGGKYRIENGRIICSVDTAKIDKQRAAERQREADRDACIKNMEEIEEAYRSAMQEGKKVKSLSDLNEWYREQFKDDPDYEDLPAKCPSGGKYKLDRGRVTCPRSEDGHIL